MRTANRSHSTKNLPTTRRHGVALEGSHQCRGSSAKLRELAKKMRPPFLAKCGGIYSSECFGQDSALPEYRPGSFQGRALVD